MVRQSILAAAVALATAGAAQAEVYIDGEANNRSIVYLGVAPTQVGGGAARIVTTGDGPQVVNPQATGAQPGRVAVITGGGNNLEVHYLPAEAPRNPRG